MGVTWLKFVCEYSRLATTSLPFDGTKFHKCRMHLVETILLIIIPLTSTVYPRRVSHKRHAYSILKGYINKSYFQRGLQVWHYWTCTKFNTQIIHTNVHQIREVVVVYWWSLYVLFMLRKQNKNLNDGETFAGKCIYFMNYTSYDVWLTHLTGAHHNRNMQYIVPFSWQLNRDLPFGHLVHFSGR